MANCKCGVTLNELKLLGQQYQNHLGVNQSAPSLPDIEFLLDLHGDLLDRKRTYTHQQVIALVKATETAICVTFEETLALKAALEPFSEIVEATHAE